MDFGEFGVGVGLLYSLYRSAATVLLPQGALCSPHSTLCSSHKEHCAVPRGALWEEQEEPVVLPEEPVVLLEHQEAARQIFFMS